MVFYWSLSDSRTLFCILVKLNVVVWIISTHSLISKFSSPCTNLLVTVLSTPITIGITVTSMFQSFFISLTRCRYLSHIVFFQFYPVVSQNCKVSFSADSLFITRSGCLAKISWSVSISKPLRILWVSFPRQILGCAHTICSYVHSSLSHV